MPSLADIVEASRTNPGGGRSYTNADLTPQARRTAAGVTDLPAETSPEGPAAAPYVAPDGGRAEQDRLLNEAKGTLQRVDPFAKMLEATGNRAAMETVNADPTKAATDQFFENYGRGIHGMADPAALVRGGVGALKGGVGAVLGGLASIPEGVKAEWDIAHNLPDTIRSLPGLGMDLAKEAGSAVSDTMRNWALNPEQGGEAVTEALGGVAAPDALMGALKYGPQAAGKAMSATGRGMSAIGESRAAKAAGKYAAPTAIFGHPGAAAAEIAVPPALRGLGGALQRGGATLEGMDIPASLRAVGNTDIGAAIDRTLTPADVPLTADEQAAAGVRASVDAARNLEAKGMSRAQAAQRTGAPYGGDLTINPETGAASNNYGPVEQGTHPGQNVEAHRPYTPVSRGRPTSIQGLENAIGPKSFADSVRALGNEIRQGGLGGGETPASGVWEKPKGSNPMLSFVDDAVGAGNSQKGQQQNVEAALADLRRQNPSPYEIGVGAREPMSPELMNRVVAEARVRPGNTQSVNLAKANTDVVAEARKLIDEKLGYKIPGAEDISHRISPEVALGKLSRSRARSRALRSNSPLAEGY